MIDPNLDAAASAASTAAAHASANAASLTAAAAAATACVALFWRTVEHSTPCNEIRALHADHDSQV